MQDASHIHRYKQIYLDFKLLTDSWFAVFFGSLISQRTQNSDMINRRICLILSHKTCFPDLVIVRVVSFCFFVRKLVTFRLFTNLHPVWPESLNLPDLLHWKYHLGWPLDKYYCSMLRLFLFNTAVCCWSPAKVTRPTKSLSAGRPQVNSGHAKN